MSTSISTRIIPVDAQSTLDLAVELLKLGQVIAIPTDTVYGAAVNGFNPSAIDRLYVIKERPRDKPIPLLLASAESLDEVAAEVPLAARALAERFWPGALTLVVPANDIVPRVLRAGGNSVAVRVPDHPIPRLLALALNRPLAASSANLSGGRDPSSAQDVLAVLGGRIPLIIDGGMVGGGVPSTVVDFTLDPPRVIRVGALAINEIYAVLDLIEHS